MGANTVTIFDTFGHVMAENDCVTASEVGAWFETYRADEYFGRMVVTPAR